MNDKNPLLKRITIEAGKCGGRPCIRGLRMRVVGVLELLSSGATFEEILEDYPTLERDDILAALEYAARQTDLRLAAVGLSACPFRRFPQIPLYTWKQVFRRVATSLAIPLRAKTQKKRYTTLKRC